MPNRMSVLASWVDVLSAIAIHETFDIFRDAPSWLWSGASSNVALNLQIEMFRGTGFKHWEINLWLRTDQVRDQLVSWQNIPIGPGPPIDSGRQSHQYPPADSWDSVHILA